MQDNTTADDDMMPYFINALKRLHWAETHIATLLEKLRDEAFGNSLKNAIEVHEAHTAEHIRRLEQVMKELGQPLTEKVCEALKGLVKDAHMTLGDTVRKTRTRDISIRGSLLRVEHYEMATYAILIQLAQAMGLPHVEQLLQQTLIEEKEMEDQLQRNHP